MDQSGFPIHLQYRRDEDVVRAEQALSSIVEMTTRKLATSNHINPKQFAEQHLMPIFAHMVAFFSMQHGDLLRFVQAALLHQAEIDKDGEVLVGIPPDDVDSLLGELERVDQFLVSLNRLGGKKQLAAEEIKKEAAKMREVLGEVAEAIQELALDSTDASEEVEEEEDFISFEEEDEEPEPPEQGDTPLLVDDPEEEDEPTAEVSQ